MSSLSVQQFNLRSYFFICFSFHLLHTSIACLFANFILNYALVAAVFLITFYLDSIFSLFFLTATIHDITGSLTLLSAPVRTVVLVSGHTSRTLLRLNFGLNSSFAVMLLKLLPCCCFFIHTHTHISSLDIFFTSLAAFYLPVSVYIFAFSEVKKKVFATLVIICLKVMI